MAFGYAFDVTRLRPSLRSLATARQVGNRTTATENGHQTDYAANLLNQYTARGVPGLAHVRGAALTDAIVTARPTIVGTPVAPPTPAVRLDETFFVPLPVDNAAAPFVGAAEVTAVLPAAAPGGEDIVATTSRPVRIPQTTQTLTYDLDGNLTSDGIWQYEWNAENRLVAMTPIPPYSDTPKLEFFYDSQGRRFRKTVYAWDAQTSAFIPQLSSLFLYSGFEQICELRTDHTQTPAVTTTLAHLRGGGQLLSTTATTGQTSDTWYFCFDGNRNIVALVDAGSATLVARYDYSPFGQLVLAEMGSGSFLYSHFIALGIAEFAHRPPRRPSSCQRR